MYIDVPFSKKKTTQGFLNAQRSQLITADETHVHTHTKFPIQLTAWLADCLNHWQTDWLLSECGATKQNDMKYKNKLRFKKQNVLIVTVKVAICFSNKCEIVIKFIIYQVAQE